MSSGVDSSVAAALLKKQGYEVIGVFLRLWEEKKGKLFQAQKSAEKIAKILNISFCVIDVSGDFHKEIINYFLRECKIGKTPNPCAVCNPKIKFNFLFKKMLAIKADCVATGHYARVIKHETRNIKQNVFKLFEARDRNKDQSYFLYALSQKQLSKILFPLGDHTKEEVRKLAKEFKLPVLDKPESQDICFISEKNTADFLRNRLKLKKGKIVNTKGNVIGEHEGLPLYTIGQRKGINIGGKGPYYVAEKNIPRNILVVTNNQKDPRLWRRSMAVEKVNWIAKNLKFPLKAYVKTRYRHPAVGVIITKKARNSYDVVFMGPQRAITPGQSAVFYSGKGEVLGGGVINLK